MEISLCITMRRPFQYETNQCDGRELAATQPWIRDCKHRYSTEGYDRFCLYLKAPYSKITSNQPIKGQGHDTGLCPNERSLGLSAHGLILVPDLGWRRFCLTNRCYQAGLWKAGRLLSSCNRRHQRRYLVKHGSEVLSASQWTAVTPTIASTRCMLHNISDR